MSKRITRASKRRAGGHSIINKADVRLDEMHTAAKAALDEIGALLKPRRQTPWHPRNAQGPSIRAFLWFRAPAPGIPGIPGIPGPRSRGRGRGRGRGRRSARKVSVGYFLVEHGPVFVIYGEPTRKGLDAVPLDRPILAVSINDLFDERGNIRADKAERAAERLVRFYANDA